MHGIKVQKAPAKPSKQIKAAPRMRNKFMFILPLAAVMMGAMAYYAPKYLMHKHVPSSGQASVQETKNASQFETVAEIAKRARHAIADLGPEVGNQHEAYAKARESLNAAKIKTAEYPEGIVLNDITGVLTKEGKKPLEFYLPSIVEAQGKVFKINYDGRLLAYAQLLNVLGGGSQAGNLEMERITGALLQGIAPENILYSSYLLNDVLKRDTIACADASVLFASIFYLFRYGPVPIMVSGSSFVGNSLAYDSPLAHLIVGYERDGKMGIFDPMMNRNRPAFESATNYFVYSNMTRVLALDLREHSPEGSIGTISLMRLAKKEEVPLAIRKLIGQNAVSNPALRKWADGYTINKSKAGHRLFHKLCPDEMVNLMTSTDLDKVFEATGYTYLNAEATLSIKAKLLQK
ncbi:MAG: hypothetical protein NTX79_03390 [Candidatus Micrarchaeota archaeon]|nr:hypothetical protein [Candidatus Micrarchaeota archaeon]